MIKIQKISSSSSFDGEKVSMYVVDNIDNWNEFTEWLYYLEEDEVSIMLPGSVYHFRSQVERRCFVLGFGKAWDVIDDTYLQKCHGDK